MQKFECEEKAMMTLTPVGSLAYAERQGDWDGVESSSARPRQSPIRGR